jgi:hypothetical protein
MAGKMIDPLAKRSLAELDTVLDEIVEIQQLITELKNERI